MSLTPSQLELRKGRIGGSMIAKVLGVSPWGGPVEAWLSLRGKNVVEENEHIIRGNLLEDDILELCQMRHPEWKVNSCAGVTLVFPENDHSAVADPLGLHFDWACVTTDAIAGLSGDPPTGKIQAIVEAKAPGIDQLESGFWGEDGTDKVPIDYFLQLQWYMGWLKAPLGILAAWFGAQEYREYVIEPRPRLFSAMVAQARKFYFEHVLTGKPPLLYGSDSFGEAMAAAYPQERRKKKVEIQADEQIERIMRRLARAKNARKRLVEIEKELSGVLMVSAGGADKIVGEAGKFSIFDKSYSKTDWDAVCRAAGINVSTIDQYTVEAIRKEGRFTAAKGNDDQE